MRQLLEENQFLEENHRLKAEVAELRRRCRSGMDSTTATFHQLVTATENKRLPNRQHHPKQKRSRPLPLTRQEKTNNQAPATVRVSNKNALGKTPSEGRTSTF